MVGAVLTPKSGRPDSNRLKLRLCNYRFANELFVSKSINYELHLNIAEGKKFPLVYCAIVSVRSVVVAQLTITMLPYGTDTPQKCPFPWGDLDPIWYMVPWAHPSLRSKWHLDRFSRFLHSSRQCPCTMGSHFSPKIFPSTLLRHCCWSERGWIKIFIHHVW